jgi:hypothetical protein
MMASIFFFCLYAASNFSIMVIDHLYNSKLLSSRGKEEEAAIRDKGEVVF